MCKWYKFLNVKNQKFILNEVNFKNLKYVSSFFELDQFLKLVIILNTSNDYKLIK